MIQGEKVCCGKCDKSADGQIKEGQDCSTPKVNESVVIKYPIKFTRTVPASMPGDESRFQKIWN